MRDPKPGEEINGAIGQEGIRGNSRTHNDVGVNGVHSWIGQSSWFPGFLIVKKFTVQAGILGLSLPAREHHLLIFPHLPAAPVYCQAEAGRIAKNEKG